MVLTNYPSVINVVFTSAYMKFQNKNSPKCPPDVEAHGIQPEERSQE